METIKNVYDGPTGVAKVIKSPKPIALDFAYSESAIEIDAGIRSTITGVKVSIMAMGIALYRVDVGGLFYNLGFTKFGEYIDKLADDTGMARTTLYNWEYIGEAYIKHRADLDKVGFSDDDGPTKLPFLPRALANYPKREVFKALKDMSKREFEAWSLGESVQKIQKFQKVKVRGNQVFAGSSPLVSFAEGISPKDRRYYEALLFEGADAVENNEYARIYRFYDEAEARSFDKIYSRELKALRTKK